MKPIHSPCLLVPLSPCHPNSATGRYVLRTHPRAGAVLIMALVCLVLVAALGGTLVRWAAMEHKLLRAKEDQSQARWLAEAGIERAAAQLAEAADYRGDTWEVVRADLPSGQPARVAIHVTPGDEDSRRRTIAVDVEYPLESHSPIRLHKEVDYQLPTGDKTS